MTTLIAVLLNALRLKDLLIERKTALKMIAKIEKSEAVDDIAGILEVSDGIMVTRGNLGVGMDPEKAALIQENSIHRCNQAGKPVTTATQMLESMVATDPFFEVH
ncbi:MAG: hypothetical protein IH613_11620 [Desulfuromonadales bacterium]|nr:hypothetical protein [Desulfuromonadales bacterium]